jgi:hypothetical protein
MNTRRRRKAGRSGWSGGGASPESGATSARCSVIAPLSVITVPSGRTSTGTWVSGFSRCSISRSAGLSKTSTDLMAKGTPARVSMISLSVEPVPGWA